MADNKASKIFLFAAIILGVLAMVMAFAYIDDTTTKGGGGTPTPILVAARDLRANTPLEPDKDFKEVSVPKLFQGFASQVLTPAVKEAYKGQRLNRRVLAGQPVMLADLSTSAKLEFTPGLCLISIPARGAQGLSGLLVPGDSVKVLITQTQSNSTGVQINTISAGEGASFRVVAVGTQLARSRVAITAVEQYDAANSSESQQTVTLEMTEAQAKEITSLSNAFRAPITLILANVASQPAAPPSATPN